MAPVGVADQGCNGAACRDEQHVSNMAFVRKLLAREDSCSRMMFSGHVDADDDVEDERSHCSTPVGDFLACGTPVGYLSRTLNNWFFAVVVGNSAGGVMVELSGSNSKKFVPTDEVLQRLRFISGPKHCSTCADSDSVAEAGQLQDDVALEALNAASNLASVEDNVAQRPSSEEFEADADAVLVVISTAAALHQTTQGASE
eukprot:TRINITY_DN123072_c0_g1_i1.p1 TRINITY_DN123072_c0_g1~~TRINITY_DN123072_c0_g1_i1.p1  ORF type:complete len:201 (-),score=35.19 TRINITY_DN123072_c0_g1_i1:215-817(-)